MAGEKSFDIAVVTRALAGADADIPDKRLGEMSTLADAGEYAEAADRARGALEEGITDARVLAFFLFGAFLEGGPTAISPIFAEITAVLDARWDAVRPEERKERVADSALAWLFRSMWTRVDFHEKMRDATWKAWFEAGSSELGAEAQARSATLRASIEARIDKARSKEPLSELDARIRSHFSRVVPPSAKAAPAAHEPERARDEAAGATPDDASVEASHSKGARGGAPARPADGARVIEVSPALDLFLRKIEGFERLVARGDLARAAIISEDIRAVIEGFDPRVYFPKLLASYFRVLSRNVDGITPHLREMDSPQWKALEQLYRVDLDAFLEE